MTIRYYWDCYGGCFLDSGAVLTPRGYGTESLTHHLFTNEDGLRVVSHDGEGIGRGDDYA